jgi:hypothetical protein
MTVRLRDMAEVLGTEDVGLVRGLLCQSADAAACQADPSAVLYLALADVLDGPGDGYCPALVAAAVMAQDARPGAVEAVIHDLMDSAEETGHPLPEELARELAGAHLLGLATSAAFSRQIEDTRPGWLL